MKKIIVIGNNIDSLLCSYVFKQYEGVEIKIIGNQYYDDFLNNGLEYVRKTKEVIRLFEKYDLESSVYTVKAGIMLKGLIEPFNQSLKKLSKNEIKRLKTDYYRKTRLIEPDEIGIKKSFSDFEIIDNRVIRTDYTYLINKLASDSNFIFDETVVRIDKDFVITDRNKYKYDYAICVLPLWESEKIVNFKINNSMSVIKNIIHLEAEEKKFFQYDVVYTPYTPSNCVYKITSLDDFVIEFSGAFNSGRILSDINFLFGDGWCINSVSSNYSGYMLPVENKTEWPFNIIPVGKFAKWESKINFDSTLDELFEVANRWFGKYKRIER